MKKSTKTTMFSILRFHRFVIKTLVLFVGLYILTSITNSCEQPSMVNADTGKVDGEKIYKYYCTSCHGPKGGRKIGKAPDLRKSTLKDDEIRKMIMFGSDKGMVAYQSLIKGEELDALVKHVKSLRN